MPKSVFTDAYQIVCKDVREARRKAGVSQTELARRLGKTQQFVSFIERGVRRVDLVEYYAVMKALGVDPADAAVRLIRAFPDEVSI
jgi:transcriptional regulator with XRE-family HTH domain